MELNDLFALKNIPARSVIALRHRPTASLLQTALPVWAEEKPHLFNLHQQTQGPALQKAMLGLSGTGFIASFIGQSPGKATFAGLYKIVSSRPMGRQEYWDIADHHVLGDHGSFNFGPEDSRESIEFFDLQRLDFYQSWCGKLIVDWPPPERSWWRRSERNTMPISAILEESSFVSTIPRWDAVNLDWRQLGALPTSWQIAMSQWRAIYFIHDISDGKGYVGSAFGEENLLGRWNSYWGGGNLDRAHGGNKLLKGRNPENFRYSILEVLSPSLPKSDVERIEASWKVRLHTRAPNGLNDN
jgi:hypothetical protein